MRCYYFTNDDLKDLEKEIDRLYQKLIRFRNKAVDVLARRDRGLEASATYTALSAMYDIYNKRLEDLSHVRNHAVVDFTVQKTDEKKVAMGKTIVVHDITVGNTLILSIGSYWIESNGNSRVAYSAPLPDLLMNARIGEIREGFISGIRKKYEIKKIT